MENKVMNKKKMQNVIRVIAERNGVSIDYVRTEIQKIIDIGINNPDPKIRAYWKSIPYKGERPTPDEVIRFFANEMINKK